MVPVKLVAWGVVDGLVLGLGLWSMLLAAPAFAGGALVVATVGCAQARKPVFGRGNQFRCGLLRVLHVHDNVST